MTKLDKNQFKIPKKAFNKGNYLLYNKEGDFVTKTFNYFNANQTEEAKLQSALDSGQERAWVRTITTKDLIRCIGKMVFRLHKLLPREKQTGASISYVFGRSYFPRSYKGTPEGTAVEVYGHSTFYTVTIYRDNCRSTKIDYVVNFRDNDQREFATNYLIQNQLSDLDIRSL